MNANTPSTTRGARLGAAVLSVCLGAFTPSATAVDRAARCLFVSSYHQGYAWSDGVERGLRRTLGSRCELRQFDMDTKRHKDEAYKRTIAEQVKTLIDTWRPDVVITADDNAAKYVIAPYYRDADVPFVFSGVNWTTEEYGFPYSNVTGIVEVAPIGAMLERAIDLSGAGAQPRAFYLGAQTLTEMKNAARFEELAGRMGLRFEHQLARTMAEWVDAFERAQAHDIVILGSNSGINDWIERDVVDAVHRHSRRLSVTSHEWMMPYAMFGMTKVPEEHGEWSAKAAIAILDGADPATIPIVANRKWDLWSNEALLSRARIELPPALRHRAKRVQ